MKKLLMNVSFDKWFDVFIGVIIACSIALIDAVGFGHSYVVAALVGSAIALSISILEETIKCFMPGRRSFNVVDMCADAIGFIISFLTSCMLLFVGDV